MRSALSVVCAGALATMGCSMVQDLGGNLEHGDAVARPGDGTTVVGGMAGDLRRERARSWARTRP